MSKNNKWGSLKIPEKVKPILEIYKNRKINDFIFHELSDVDFSDNRMVRPQTKTVTRTCNRHLK